MASPPYMQWYPGDYMADTADLTTVEHGAYTLILWNYWMTGKPPRINRLWIISKMSSSEAWAPVQQELEHFFIVDGDVWKHERLESDLAAAFENIHKKSKAGKSSALSRAAKKRAGAAAELPADPH